MIWSINQHKLLGLCFTELLETRKQTLCWLHKTLLINTISVDFMRLNIVHHPCPSLSLQNLAFYRSSPYSIAGVGIIWPSHKTTEGGTRNSMTFFPHKQYWVIIVTDCNGQARNNKQDTYQRMMGQTTYASGLPVQCSQCLAGRECTSCKSVNTPWQN